jgi:hypothetical protein
MIEAHARKSAAQRAVPVLAAIAIIAVISYRLLWFSAFTDTLNRRVSPDGKLAASYVVEAHGPMAPVTYGITVGHSSTDARRAAVILITSEDNQPIDIRWISATNLEIVLRCADWQKWRDTVGFLHPVKITYRQAASSPACKISPTSPSVIDRLI